MASIIHILVASDLTERSRPALQRALQLKQQLGAEMTLLHVIEPGLPPAVTERRRQEALSVLGQEINAAFRASCGGFPSMSWSASALGPSSNTRRRRART